MSGGVDSSVSLMLLKNAGFDVIGVSLKYEVYKCSRRKENVCCSKESFDIARKICDSFGCKHEIIDVADSFNEEVIEYFKKELKNSRTPSPCVFCNRKVKFKALFEYADKVGAKFVATGHYAKIKYEEFEDSKQYLLTCSADEIKDQTYSLSFLNKQYLSRIIFPLGELNKADVYSLAKKNEIFDEYKKIKQSQDFCFIDSSELDNFINLEVRPSSGKVIDESGLEIGSHDGLSHYTLGQRKGIRLPGGPYYVIEKKEPNILVVSKDVSLSYSKDAVLKPFNLLISLKDKTYEVWVKARSSDQPRRAILNISKESLHLSLSDQNTQLVPGQIAVLYLDQDDSKERICLGSGVINI